MIKIGPNEDCPCGSKKTAGRRKKYKECYCIDKFQNTCKVFLQENCVTNVPRIQEFFDKVVNEVVTAILALQPKYHETFRVQCVISFSFLETISKIRSEFVDLKTIDGLPPGDKEIFVEWFDRFIAVEGNEERKEAKSLHELNGMLLYKLRSSLGHGLALPHLSDKGVSIAIFNEPEGQKADELRTGFLKEGVKLILISPNNLYSTILKGAILMINTINTNTQSIEYLQGVQRISNRLDINGAVEIKVPKHQN